MHYRVWHLPAKPLWWHLRLFELPFRSCKCWAPRGSNILASLRVSNRHIVRRHFRERPCRCRIYVNVPGAETIADEDITVRHASHTIELRVSIPDAKTTHVLKLAPLQEKITAASTRRKGDRITVTLTKATENTWFELLRKGPYDYDDDF